MSRNLAISSTVCNSFNALIVARTIFCFVLEPYVFVEMSLYPASSTTARTVPEAIIPAPLGAGRNWTFEAKNLYLTSCGIDPLTIGTLIIFFCASLTAFLIASCTSFAFPWPKQLLLKL